MTSYRYGGIGIAAAIAMVVALGACGGGGDKQQTAEEQLDEAFDQLSEDLDEPVDTTVEEEAEPPPDPVVVDLDLPREAVYAQATWSVTKVSYQGPGAGEFGEELPPQAIVGFSVANTGEGGEDQDVAYELLSLLDGDGARIPADDFTFEPETVVFGGRGEFEVTFPLDEDATEDDLADYTFQVGADGKEPAPIPLSGTMAEPVYPMTLTMPGPLGGNMLGGDGTLGNVHGTVTLDYAGQRADEGTRFLVVTGDVTSAGPHSIISHYDMRVSVDGIELDRAQPVPIMEVAGLPEGATGSGLWVFVIPVDGKDGQVHFGQYSPPENPTGPFTVPELP